MTLSGNEFQGLTILKSHQKIAMYLLTSSMHCCWHNFKRWPLVILPYECKKFCCYRLVIDAVQDFYRTIPKSAVSDATSVCRLSVRLSFVCLPATFRYHSGTAIIIFTCL